MRNWDILDHCNLTLWQITTFSACRSFSFRSEWERCFVFWPRLTLRSGYNSIKVFSSPESRRDERDTCGHVWLAGSSSREEITLLSLLSGFKIYLTYFSLQTFSLLDEFFLLIKSVLCSRGGARSSKVCHEGNRNVWRKWLMPTWGGTVHPYFYY